MAERRWVGECVQMKFEGVTQRGHRTETVDQFGEGVAPFLANTAGDNVGFAGEARRRRASPLNSLTFI
ncbi:hypothetical protein [Halocatena marina]|uniref:hypothetical protein n=1 Tax=Halocatena marina TaxID=2934937 RepID=UPI00200F39D7|nr:hypothetical protein [Halocatena marina]